MDKKLRERIDSFYNKKEELDVFELIEIADIIVPQLDKLVGKLMYENNEMRRKTGGMKA